LVALSPAWVPALLTRLPGSAPADNVAGEAVVEGGPKPLAAAEPPRPGVDGLDLEQQLRELDLYQPAPSPDRPGPTSGRPGERRGQELLARTPADVTVTLLAELVVASEEGVSPRWMAGLAEIVNAMAADLGADSTPAEMSDAVMVQAPSSWGEERWRLLGLAGLALWSWPGYGSRSEGEAQRKPERRKGRPAKSTSGGGTDGASTRGLTRS
jgi:hypothetical protein